jgi:hypothetical protein
VGSSPVISKPDRAGQKPGHHYYSEVFGITPKAPIRSGEFILSAFAIVTLAVVLKPAMQLIAEGLFPEPSLLRFLPVIGWSLVSVLPLVWLLKRTLSDAKDRWASVAPASDPS